MTHATHDWYSELFTKLPFNCVFTVGMLVTKNDAFRFARPEPRFICDPSDFTEPFDHGLWPLSALYGDTSN